MIALLIMSMHYRFPFEAMATHAPILLPSMQKQLLGEGRFWGIA